MKFYIVHPNTPGTMHIFLLIPIYLSHAPHKDTVAADSQYASMHKRLMLGMATCTYPTARATIYPHVLGGILPVG